MTADALADEGWLGLARRTGFADPLTIGALTTAAASWGASVATPYTAAAIRFPTRSAIIDEFGAVSYAKLELRTSRLATSLRSIGLGPKSVVGLLCRNHRGFVETTIAAAKLGTRVVYLNTGLPAAQLAEVVERERITCVVGDRDLVDQFQHHRRAPQANPISIVAVDPAKDADWSFPTLRQPKLPFLLPRPFGSATPVILTSGTSGAPKGTQRSNNPRTSVGALGFIESVPYQVGDVVAVPAPLFHAWGLSQMIVAATMAGTVVLRRQFDPIAVANDVERHHVNVLAAVPVMLHRMLEAGVAPRVKRLRVVATSGSALAPGLAERWMDAAADHLYSMYGSTEVGQVSVATPGDLRMSSISAGRPMRGVEVRIVDEAGNPVEQGEIGRIVVRSDSHFDGYTGGGSKEVLDGFMDIGDQGQIGDDGCLIVMGRSDDMIISGGENLYPANIERALLLHPAVSEAVVVGVEDADLGQRVRAVIILDAAAGETVTAADLKRHLGKHLAKYEVPREFRFIDDLPRNPAGKILRRELQGELDD